MGFFKIHILKKEHENPLRGIQFLIAGFLGALGLWAVMHSNPTAYEWPAADMFPFFARLQDPNFLTGDFWTESTSAPNARFVFGYLINAMVPLFKGDWYATLFFVKIILATGMPILFFLTLLKATEDPEKKEKQTVSNLNVILMCGAGTAFAVGTKVTALFGIAFWRPYPIYAHSHPLGIFLGLTALYFAFTNRKVLACLFIIFSTSIHPINGLFITAFYGLCRLNRILKDWKFFTCFTACALLTASIISFYFRSQTSLSAKTFVDIYVRERHPWHYLPSQFGYELAGLPWWIAFFIILCLLLAPGLFIRNLSKQTRMLSFSFAGAYGGSIALQYFMVELIPVKIIATLGPARFSLFGYWMLLILYASALKDFFPFKVKRKLPLTLLSKNNFFYKMPLLIVLIATLWLGVQATDDPFSSRRNQQKDFYAWLESTPPHSVFALPFTSTLNIDLVMIGKRSLYAPSAFPFSENYYTEYAKRYCALYGCNDKKGNLSRDSRINYYRALKYEDFFKIAQSEKLDYFVIERGFEESFSALKPQYENKEILVYQI